MLTTSVHCVTHAFPFVVWTELHYHLGLVYEQKTGINKTLRDLRVYIKEIVATDLSR